MSMSVRLSRQSAPGTYVNVSLEDMTSDTMPMTQQQTDLMNRFPTAAPDAERPLDTTVLRRRRALLASLMFVCG